MSFNHNISPANVACGISDERLQAIQDALVLVNGGYYKHEPLSASIEKIIKISEILNMTGTEIAYVSFMIGVSTKVANTPS